MNIWLISDTHFSHGNIIHKFIPPRPFANIQEHDECLVDNWNSLVKPEDHCYHLGDVVMKRRDLPIVKKLNGHKRLVRGNHDIFKTKEYLDVGFEEIYGVRVFTKGRGGVMLTHIPVHPNHLIHEAKNIHGHLHFNRVMKDGEIDDRYISVCVEHTDYKPVPLELYY